MSTRGLYTFKDEGASFNVYKHQDAYPSGAARTLKTALNWFAWKLPRFEANEFAAAFCAAWAKEYGPGGTYHGNRGGGVRLMPSGDPTQVACKECNDIEYRYEIFMGTPLPKIIEARARKQEVKPNLIVKAFSGNWWDGKEEEKLIYSGSFNKFYTWALKKDKAAA
jgi:hypothetical protein